MSFATAYLGSVVTIDRDQRLWNDRPYIGLEDIESGTGRLLGDGSVKSVKSTSFGFDKRHVLYGRLRPYLNKVFLPDFIGHCSTEVFPLRPAYNLDRRYLWYWLTSFDTVQSIDATCTGARMPRANMEQVLALEIPLPSLEEQRRIVAVLDEVFAAIATATANAEKNLANARELFELERDAIVSGGGPDWIEGPLGEACETQYGISGSMNAEGNGYKIFRMGEVQDGRMIDTGAMKYIDISEPEFKPYRLRRGDVLFNRTNSIALVGKTGIFSLEGPYCFASYLIRVNFDPARMSSHFACYMLNSRSFLNRVRSKAAQSVNQANINATVLRNERVRYPSSVAEQEGLADKLDSLRQHSDELAEVYERKLAQLAALKQSLLQRAFVGDLTRRKTTTPEASNDNFATPEFTANVIAYAYWLHKKHKRDKSFKRVKAQKCLHNVEAIGGIELGRQPRQCANGPHDEQHMARAQEWAQAAGFFEFVQSTSGPGYDFRKLPNYEALWPKAIAATKPVTASLEHAIDPLVSMNMEEAELFTTVHAAWNNLIRDGVAITVEAIVTEARENWDPPKTRFPESKFHTAIKLIKSRGMVPDGSAKYVHGQARLI